MRSLAVEYTDTDEVDVMELRESLRISTRSVRAHKLRAALTVVGIVIGIAAVVTFVTFGASLKADVVSEIGGSSANNVYLVATSEEEGGFGGAPQPVFTEHDRAELARLDGVERVVPRGQLGVTALSYRGDTVARRQVTATTRAAFATATFDEGRVFRAGRSEAVLNRRAASLFERNVTVGGNLTLTLSDGERATVRVVGVVNGSGGQLPFSSFSDAPRVFLPTDPFYRTLVESPTQGVDQRVYPQLTVVATPGETTGAKERVRGYLDVSDAAALVGGEYEPTAQTNSDLVERIERIISRLTRFVTGIAVLSLLVGSIGIANIMLVSVTERTREIGIMKAVGARNRDVMQLFVVEAVLLGAFGALIGVPLGIAGGWAATQYAEIPLTLAPEWFAIAVGVGGIVGVVAGLYPAWRAARVDPIEALRYE
jgi:putative ABC transport system permease protein